MSLPRMRRHAFVLAFAAILLGGCGRSGEATRPEETVAGVRVTHLRRGEIVRSLTLPGDVRPYQEAILYAKVAGYLKSIAVDTGDQVKEGQVLAEILAPEMLADLDKVKTEASVAALDYRRLRDAQKKAPDLVMPRTVDTAQGEAEKARANLRRIETLLGYAKITAPFDGIVTRRWVDPGAFIPAATSSSAARNAAVVTVMDFSRVRVEVAVPEPEVPHVRRDLPVEVTASEIQGRTFSGTVTRFAYALDDATKTMPAEIEIANGDGGLRPGMMVSVRMAVERIPDALLLPAEALMTEKDRSSVYVVQEGKAVRTPVETGFDDGVSVEIRKGIEAGASIVVAGQQGLSDGQAVKVVGGP